MPALGNKTTRLIEAARVDRLMMAIIGVGVIFASLGLGEAVYRMLFFDFDGATDRLPIELIFGFLFAYIAAKLVAKLYRKYKRNSTKIETIRDRNERIRRAVAAISHSPYPDSQQAIRVIREQVERIDCELSDVASRH